MTLHQAFVVIRVAREAGIRLRLAGDQVKVKGATAGQMAFLLPHRESIREALQVEELLGMFGADLDGIFVETYLGSFGALPDDARHFAGLTPKRMKVWDGTCGEWRARFRPYPPNRMDTSSEEWRKVADEILARDFVLLPVDLSTIRSWRIGLQCFRGEPWARSALARLDMVKPVKWTIDDLKADRLLPRIPRTPRVRKQGRRGRG